MKLPAIQMFTVTALFAAMGLSGCGGGGSSGAVPCPTGVGALCPFITTGGTTGSTSNASPVALFTTAPSAITLISASAATYTVSGGTGPYTATSGNTAVIGAAVSGTTLTLTSIATGGPVQIAIVDAVGKSVLVNVTVVAKGQGVAPSLFPAAITVADCTTNIPFVFTGGTAPFTVFSSDVGVPVGSPLPLSSDSYFLASVDASKIAPPPDKATVEFPYSSTVTILDSQSRTATSTLSIGNRSLAACAPKVLLEVAPASANVRLSGILSFRISGGASPFTLSSRNSAVAAPSAVAVDVNGNASFTVQGNAVGTTLVTVRGQDNQQASIVFTTLPVP